ncbi:MAG: selenocysteine synthase, partial [Terriglobia bacterium]
WWARLQYISKQLRSVRGVTTAFFVPEIANHVPTMRIEWDPLKLSLTTDQARTFLKSGNPAVMLEGGSDGVSLSMNSFMLQPGEERIIASRLKQMFQAHGA